MLTLLTLLTLILPTASTSMATLPACPQSPNCVSSQASDTDHYIQAFAITVEPERAWQTLINILKQQKRTKITQQTQDWLHAEATSLIFRFVDDLQFFWSTDRQTIHVYSASRTGYSDLGVNRKRIEKLRQLLREESAIK